MGTASAIASMLLFWKRPDLTKIRKESGLTWQSLVKEQWRYGRWSATATVLSFLANQIQVFILAWVISLQVAGALDALQNFTAPIAQGIVAIATLALPVLSYDFGQENFSAIRHKMVIVVILLAGIAGVYELLMWRFRSQLESLLYRGKYAAFSPLIPILGLIPIFTAITTGYSLVLRAIQKPQFYLIYGIIVAPVGLMTGIIFSYFWGLDGAVWSLVVISFLTLIVHMVLYRRWFIDSMIRKRETHEAC